MLNGCAHGALWQVAQVLRDGTFTGTSDRQILERFVEHRDERAFEALLLRHGPMVFNVCRRFLRDQGDVEDAFQSVFVALVRKARTIRVDDSLGPWLYTVATRLAARARANRRRRMAREISAGEELPELPIHVDFDRHEIPRVVHEELGRLPGRLRAPLVLCYLEGMTHESAAHQLGCPVGTVRSRLAKGRGLLRKRISRRGMTLSVPALAVLLESNSHAVAISASSRTALTQLMLKLVSESAAESRGLGLAASAAAISKGALHVLRIRIPAAFGTTMFAAGVLGIVIASRALVVGQTPSTAAAPPSQAIGPRQLGPDGRPIGGGRQDATETFVKTYFVGDLIWARMSRPPEPASPTASSPTRVDTAQPRPDMSPLIRLIASTVAPDTWRVHDEKGLDVTAETFRTEPITDRSPGASQVGSITPFYPSVSLIVRGTAETHARVGTLLRGLRAVVAARDANSGPRQAQEAIRPRRRAPTEPANDDSTDDASEQPASPGLPLRHPTLVVPTPVDRTKLEQLLEELRKEVEKLPKQAD